VFLVEHDKDRDSGQNNYHYSTDKEFITVTDHDNHDTVHDLLIP
jgi:hypothetical protein